MPNFSIYLLPWLAVIVFSILVWIPYLKNKLNNKLLLSFSASFLLSLTFFELLPEVYHSFSVKTSGALILLGIFIQIVLESFSKGAEHGHLHGKNITYKTLLIILASLCVHSFLEGLTISHQNDLVFGIALHKIPVALVFSSFLLHSTKKFWLQCSLIFLFSIATPLGTLVAQYHWIDSSVLLYLKGIVVGIFLHISTVILFESTDSHKFNLGKMLLLISGALLAYFI